MTRPTYTECAWLPDWPIYRYACRVCHATGEWVRWLSEAEREGDAHEREAHPTKAVA